MEQSPEVYLTVEDMAGIFGVSVKTIQNRLSIMKAAIAKRVAANSDILPKPSKLPLCDGPRWLPSSVARWQRAHDEPRAEAKKVGRPTKAEQIAKRLSQSVANGSGNNGNHANDSGKHRANRV